MNKSKINTKRMFSVISVFVLLIVGSSASFSASTYDRIYYNAKPGFWDKFGIRPDPSDCRSAVANLNGSGDHLFGSLYHAYTDTNGYKWGTPIETFNAVKGHYYYTPKATISCESYDGAYGEVRNKNYPTEKFVNRYQYNF